MYLYCSILLCFFEVTTKIRDETLKLPGTKYRYSRMSRSDATLLCASHGDGQEQTRHSVGYIHTSKNDHKILFVRGFCQKKR